MYAHPVLWVNLRSGVVLKKRLLVTGLTGFVGRHLQAHIDSAQSVWELASPPGGVDLVRPETLEAWCSDPPDAVIHLAGQTFVPESFRDPSRTIQVNLLGTLNLLQALKRGGFNGTFLFVSSGDVYGQVAESVLPISEELAPKPRNPYAVSKVAAELLCQQWGYAEDWRVLVARPFNHIGPGQAAGFVVPSMARQMVGRAAGERRVTLEVGDIDVTRDFLDVRDVVSAYFALLEGGRSGEIYNVCSGVERSVREVILQMAELEGISVDLVQDSARMRPADQRRVVGCAEKLKKDTGWMPSISITKTLRSVLSDWEAREP